MDRPIKTRLLALARKTLDESSPEPERVTSGNMLAREVIKLLNSGDVSIPFTTVEQEAAERADHTVRQAVAHAEAKARVETDPESPPTWVEFDPPPSPGFREGFGGEFGRPPRRRR